MDSSDDEAETLPQRLSNYHFVDQDDSPVPFYVLPLVWTDDGDDDDGVPAGGVRTSVFLHGEADNGLQKIYKEVKAWRFDLTNANPEISVLAKDGKWSKLHKPRKWFEDSVRSVLITIRGLHYLRRNTNVSEDAFWDYLARVFGSYDVRPSAKDLANHLPVITEARARDGLLANAKLLNTFLEEKPWRRRASGEDPQSVTKPNFIVTNQEEGATNGVEAESDDAEDDCFDSVCAFCDNGGNILCCDGKCMRSFHTTLEDGEDSLCDSLGLTQEQVDTIDTFYCKNCEYNQHQCFACGKLGSSDKSKGAEVFQCVSATCGYFYHPLCVAKLLHCQDGDAAENLHKKILSGEPFTCPLHKCCVCSQLENKEDHALQFAVCRRCPKAYHRKCLPREIAFETSDKNIAARAWENLLPKRILIYCLKHKIIEDLGTPVRDHIKFPGEEAKRTVVGEKRKGLPSTLCLNRGKEITKQSFLSYASLKTAEKEAARKEKLSLATELGEKRKRVIASSRLDALKKVKVVDPSKPSRNSSVKSGLLQEGQASVTSGKPSLGERLYSYVQQCSEEVNLDKKVTSEGNLKSTKPKSVSKKLDRVDLSLDPDSKKRIMDLMKDATYSVSMKDVLQKHKIMSTHTRSHNSVVEKAMTVGKLDAAVEAVRAALERLEAGGSIEDAQAVCGRNVLGQIFKWKDKLRVYLAPFLHGMHYTSFGRHFTKVEKLQEIVDKLHYYVQDGDTVVDFCCGANDFSCLLAKRLEENGKKCSYKNYDILPPKNGFHFERKDWMTVLPKDMPLGSKLIIGLNPPFGVRGASANKFVDKALEFRPKLIILIVPAETERLDLKKTPYDLIWEDNRFLSGKSFYLPGSVDINDKQVEQWNCSTPLLYLWSRQDWSTKHKAIAKTRGHLSPEGSLLEESYINTLHYPRLTGNRSLSGDNAMDGGMIDGINDRVSLSGSYGRSLSMNHGEKASRSGRDYLNYLSHDGTGVYLMGENGRETNERLPLEDQCEEMLSIHNASIGLNNRSSYDGQSSRSHLTTMETPHYYPTRDDPMLSEENPMHSGMTDGINRVSLNGHHIRSLSRNNSENDKRNNHESLDHRYVGNSVYVMDRNHGEVDEKLPLEGRHEEMLSIHNASIERMNRLPCEGQSSRSMSIDAEPGDEVHGRHFEPASMPLSPPELGNIHGDIEANIADGMSERCTFDGEEFYHAQRISSVVSPHTDYGFRNLEGHYADSYRPYAAEDGGGYLRDDNLSSRIRLFGQQDPVFPETTYIGHDAGGYGHELPGYRHLGSSSEPLHLRNMSAIQRYSPQLDELNHARVGLSHMHEPLPPPLPSSILGDPRGLHYGHHSDWRGFASGPYRPYCHSNSSGWRND